MLVLILKCKATPVLWTEVPQASAWTGISQCHATRAGWKSGFPIPLNFPPVFSELSWAAMGGAGRRTPPKVLGCTADKILPRAGQTNPSPVDHWFPPQAHLDLVFQAASRFSLPTSSFPGQLGAISSGWQIPFKPMPALFLIPSQHQFSVSSMTAISLLWSSASCCSRSSLSPHHVVLQI